MRHLNIIALIFVILISGCAGKKKNDIAQDTPENVYLKAAEMFREKNYGQAAELFSKVIYEFPYYEGAKNAMVMEVYAYYLDHDYDNMTLTIDNFLKMYPTSSEISYMYYMKALGFYEQINIPYRDQNMTFKAKEALENLIQRFPGVKYSRDAKVKLGLVEDRLAAQEMIIGRYYLNRGELLSAIKRFNVVINDYSTTSHIEEALYRLSELYIFMDNVAEAQKFAATLGYNYPKSKWYKSAYDLIEQRKKQANKP
ncbi:MAG: outer membrane protein assembly factor BamD [Rickettsiales bacterium]|nr:outer membrane protein assembly factor BamD [Rickettsiales bacterium]